MTQLKNEYAVLGDIGGTNARLLLAKIVKGVEKPEIVKTFFYRTNDHKGGLEEILDNFLDEFRGMGKYPKIGVIAVACPVNNNIAEKFANCIWPAIDGANIAEKFGLMSLTLLNDFAAVGHSLNKITEQDIFVVNEGKASKLGIKAIIGPGTGLGVAYVSRHMDDNLEISEMVNPTESGHTHFPVNDDLEAEWKSYYMKRNPACEYFRTEQAFCGPSIPIMHDFFAQREGQTETTKMSGKEIFSLARSGKDEIARKTLDFFLKIYGEYVSNLAVSLMPSSGIYLVGGLTASLRDEIAEEDGPFLTAFYNKGFLNSKLRMLRIAIIEVVELGLLGCYALASREIFASD